MDLQNLFTTVLNMTITGSIVIFCVILARTVLKNAPRVYAWMLWLVVCIHWFNPLVWVAFAVCGTGLETTEILLAGQTATVGTYDGAAVWDFIRFDEHFAVWGQGHERWWAEYGDAAMEILDSAVFGK